MLKQDYKVIDVTIPGTDATFKSDADFERFRYVMVDDEIVPKQYYTAKDGCTEVTIKYEYLKTLPNGTHIVKIVSDDGYADAKLEVQGSTATKYNGSTSSSGGGIGGSSSGGTKGAKTGDAGVMGDLFLLMILVAAGLVVLFVLKLRVKP